MSDSFKIVGVILLSFLLIYILIHIFRRMNRSSQHHNNIHNKENTKSKFGSESCLDKYEYNDCPCHKNKTKELFTMAQSVFPLHAPTLPAFSQILNENMSNISDSYMENTEANPLTREFPSQETSTGFFNVKGDALILQKH